MQKFLDPKNDIAFKRVFGSEEHKDILIHFLNDIIGFPDKIQTASLLKANQDPEIAGGKQSILDITCADEKGRQYIVEMQVSPAQGFVKRAQFYAARAYAQQLRRGDHYKAIREVIFIAITDFTMFPNKDDYISTHIILDKKTHEHDLKDFYFCFLDLSKFNKKIEELKTITEKWMYFLKNAESTEENQVSSIAGSDFIISKAYEALSRFSWKEEEMASYLRQQKRIDDDKAILLAAEEIGLQKGLEKGIEQGRQREREALQKQIVAAMLANGMNVGQIATLLEMPQCEIERMR